ncbi:hypothetical protein [Saltatorellus ferox]|uniref:hypothetical protein n=1 Tax=Saltatorellus ferox TaxID=2528018 RepID=UPI003AF3E7B5
MSLTYWVQSDELGEDPTVTIQSTSVTQLLVPSEAITEDIIRQDLPDAVFDRAVKLVKERYPGTPSTEPRATMLLSLDLISIKALFPSVSTLGANATSKIKQIYGSDLSLDSQKFGSLMIHLSKAVGEASAGGRPPSEFDPLDESTAASFSTTFQRLTSKRLNLESTADLDFQSRELVQLGKRLIRDLIWFASGRLLVDPTDVQPARGEPSDSTSKLGTVRGSGLFNCAPNGPFYLLLPALAVQMYRRAKQNSSTPRWELWVWEWWMRASIAGLEAYADTGRNGFLHRSLAMFSSPSSFSEQDCARWTRSRISHAAILFCDLPIEALEARFSALIRTFGIDSTSVEFERGLVPPRRP